MSAFLYLRCGIFQTIYMGFALGLRPEQLLSKPVREFEGRIISNNSLQTADGSVLYCQMLCLRDRTCLSFFHNRITSMCQTHGVVFFNPDDGQLSPGSRYYRQVQDMCPSKLGYIYNRALDFCYKLHYLNASGPGEAGHVCREEEGNLVILDTMDKISHIGWTIGASTFPVTDMPGFLIGATDEGYMADDWHWPDGEQVDQIVWNWCPARPINSNRNYIAVVTSGGYPPACMKDVRKGAKLFICERRM